MIAEEIDIVAKIREIRGISGILMCSQKADNDLSAALEAIWDLAREIERSFETEALEAR